MWLCIGRLCFRRALKTHILKNSKEKIGIYILSEFDGEINILGECQIKLEIINIHTKNIVITHILQQSIFSFTLQYPEECGFYQCSVSILKSPENYIILPLLSSTFEIVEEVPSNWNILCPTFRPFQFEQLNSNDLVNIVIKEDRGLTMGSHLWDSSIIMYYCFNEIFLEHLHSLIQNKSSQLIGVELGAGCSLIGIRMSKLLLNDQPLFQHIYCTDLQNQLSLINDNITLNDLSSEVISSYELDWSSKLNIEQFLTSITTTTPSSSSSCSSYSSSSSLSNLIDVIVASDVLYQKDMADNLFSTISSLSTSNHTIIFIAQKIRSNDRNGETSLDLVDVKTYNEFNSLIILQEANVIVWKLIKK